jgi:hypothetical protein
LLSFLDRVNISQARLDGLEKDLGLKGNQFQIALLVFFVSAPLRFPTLSFSPRRATGKQP